MSRPPDTYAANATIVAQPWLGDPDLAVKRVERLWRKTGRSWRPEDIVTALHRLARYAPAGPDDMFVRRLAGALSNHLGGPEVRDPATAAWALAMLGVRDAGLFTAIGAEVLRRGGGFGKTFSLTAWSLAVVTAAGALGLGVLEDFLRQTPSGPVWAEALGGESLSQLHLAALLVGHTFTGRVAGRIATQLEQVRRCPPAQNEFELAVGRALGGLDVSSAPQAFFEGYFIDLLVEVPGGPVALECDGDRYHRPGCGDDALKDTLLGRAGLRVVRVTESDWAAAPDRQLLLATRLGLT